MALQDEPAEGPQHQLGLRWGEQGVEPAPAGFDQALGLLLAGLQTISHELYEAAEVDGATRWQTFIGITAPLLRPVMLVAVALRTIGAFRAFDIIYVLTGNGGPAESTKVLAFYAYDQAFRYLFFGYGAAVSWLITECMLVWIMLYLRLLRPDIGT